MLQISNIDKETEEVLFYLVKKNGGTIVSYKDEINFPEKFSKKQILSINKRLEEIEKNYSKEALAFKNRMKANWKNNIEPTYKNAK